MKTLPIAFCAMLMSLVLAASASSQVGSYRRIGLGCAGSVGVPRLDAVAESLPFIGETFSVELTNVPIDGVAVGIVGLSNTSWGAFILPLDLAFINLVGCTLYTDVRRLNDLVIAGGTATWDLTLPSSGELIGRSFFQQVAVVDPGIPGLGLVMSDANEGVIGAPPFALIAYVANTFSNNVTTFRIDPTTGALSEVGTEVAAGFEPLSVTVDPTGRFAYVANFFSNNVTTFRINPTTGALAEVGSEVAAGSRPFSVTVDPTGRFAYVANE